MRECLERKRTVETEIKKKKRIYNCFIDLCIFKQQRNHQSMQIQCLKEPNVVKVQSLDFTALTI